jgi:hypothetical protein
MMGREVRRVPKNWVHPMVEVDRYINGRIQKVMDHQPMYDEDFETAMDDWYAGFKAHKPEDHDGSPYWDWEGGPPDPKYYRPKWTDAERTHLMMYEDTSEGTPISPAFETPEELARWLADNGASSFGSMTATYEQWLPICQGGWAPSMVMDHGVIKSGVEFASDRGVK